MQGDGQQQDDESAWTGNDAAGDPQGARRAIRYGNGWIPLTAREADPIALAAEFRKLTEESGRKADELELTAYGLILPEPDALKKLADAGYDRAVVGLMPGDDDVTIPMLDELAKRVRL